MYICITYTVFQQYQMCKIGLNWLILLQIYTIIKKKKKSLNSDCQQFHSHQQHE